jgi:hypothetical protein
MQSMSAWTDEEEVMIDKSKHCASVCCSLTIVFPFSRNKDNYFPISVDVLL